MLKRFTLALAVILLLGAVSSSPVAHAGGGLPMTELTASAGSATADGVAKITFVAFVYDNTCSDGSLTSEPTCSGGATVTGKHPYANAPVNVYLTSGSDVTFSGTSLKTGSDGKVSFTASSKTAGSKTITASQVNASHPSAVSKTVSFVAPAPAPAPPKTTTTASSSTPVATTQQAAAPATPTTTGFEVNGQTVASGEKPTVEQNKPFVLKGTTVPNGVVKLYVFSTPREATVTADAAGNWSYEVKDLEPGSHHVEAEVTDPKTQKTSERKTLAEFTIAPASTAPVATSIRSTNASNKKPLALGVVAAILVLIAVAIWLIIQRNKKHHAMTITSGATTIVPSETEASVNESVAQAPANEGTPADKNTAGDGEKPSDEESKN